MEATNETEVTNEMLLKALQAEGVTDAYDGSSGGGCMHVFVPVDQLAPNDHYLMFPMEFDLEGAEMIGLYHYDDGFDFESLDIVVPFHGGIVASNVEAIAKWIKQTVLPLVRPQSQRKAEPETARLKAGYSRREDGVFYNENGPIICEVCEDTEADHVGSHEGSETYLCRLDYEIGIVEGIISA